MDTELLEKHIESGVINRNPHPYFPLSILNYTPRCQYERLWDNVTLQCRGLVMQGQEVIARPFRKFFNDTEHSDGEIPWHLPCEVTEKMDGSLLIVFNFEGEWQYATRGSFGSPQAERGKQIFRRNYSEELLSPAFTYLFEVIFPENRIVLDYGCREDCVLLGVVNPKTGTELPLSATGGLTKVRQLPPDADAKQLRTIIRDDEEGYVIRFENGFRVKVKGQRYMELHRMITGISSRSIWETLSQGKSFNELLDVVPDEFGDWVRREKNLLIEAFDLKNERTEEAYVAAKLLPDRKSQAMMIRSEFTDVSSSAFAALDGKPTTQIIWKQIYPEFRRPEAMARVES